MNGNRWRNQFLSVLGLAALITLVSLLTSRTSHSAGGAVPVQVVNSPASPVVSR